jgi:hypothetical protein
VALASNALTTLATVKAELGIADAVTTHDARIERLINAASDAIERHCGRQLSRATVTDERVKGFGTQHLLLARTPIVSVTSVELDDSTVDADSYYIESAEAGMLFAPDGWEWTAPFSSGASPSKLVGLEESRYLVTYVGGYQTPAQGGTRTLPYDLEHACILAVVGQFRDAGKFARIATEQKEKGRKDWSSGILPGPSLEILQKYRRIG